MDSTTPPLRQRIAVLRWTLPVSFALLAVVYQLGPARWVHDLFGHAIHYGVEILFYATAGPLLTYWTLTRLGQWLDEKESAEKNARASAQRLASITAVSADAILGLDSEGRIESWNRGADLIFGFSAAEILGQPLSGLLGGGDAAQVEFRWLVESAQLAGYVRGHETTCRDVAGRPVAVDVTVTPLTNEAGRCLGMSVILRDITERQHREAEIRRLNTSLSEQVTERTSELAVKVDQLARANADLQQLDRMRSELVSLVSHQLRAPLTNMHGAVEHIEANCQVRNTVCVRMLAILNQQVERLDRLVRDVLNTARIESGKLVIQPEPISVLPVVQQVVEQIRARAINRPFELPTKPGLPLVLADRDRVAEVLANLLDNADQYSPRGQAVAIEVRADQTEVTLSVRDAGPGLLRADLERVFDKYYRADNSDSQVAYGYGLGLFICRSLVEAQGGRIWAENTPQGGALFSFTLPVAR